MRERRIVFHHIRKKLIWRVHTKIYLYIHAYCISPLLAKDAFCCFTVEDRTPTPSDYLVVSVERNCEERSLGNTCHRGVSGDGDILCYSTCSEDYCNGDNRRPGWGEVEGRPRGHIQNMTSEFTPRTRQPVLPPIDLRRFLKRPDPEGRPDLGDSRRRVFQNHPNPSPYPRRYYNRRRFRPPPYTPQGFRPNLRDNRIPNLQALPPALMSRYRSGPGLPRVGAGGAGYGPHARTRDPYSNGNRPPDRVQSFPREMFPQLVNQGMFTPAPMLPVTYTKDLSMESPWLENNDIRGHSEYSYTEPDDATTGSASFPVSVNGHHAEVLQYEEYPDVTGNETIISNKTNTDTAKLTPGGSTARDSTPKVPRGGRFDGERPPRRRLGNHARVKNGNYGQFTSSNSNSCPKAAFPSPLTFVAICYLAGLAR